MENWKNLFWVYQNGNFLPGKKHFTPGKKSGKNGFALRKICLLRPCHNDFHFLPLTICLGGFVLWYVLVHGSSEVIIEYIPCLIYCLGVKFIRFILEKIILNCLIVTFIILELLNELFLWEVFVATQLKVKNDMVTFARGGGGYFLTLH